MADRYKTPRRFPVYRIGRVIIVPILKLVSAYEIEGRENIPKSGPVILAGTHRSYLDPPHLGVTTWRIVHFMGKIELWKHRFAGWFLTQTATFPVRRGLRDRQSLRIALEILDSGGVLGIFPEGARKDGPVVEDLHGGCVYLAQKANAPIVPVALWGTDHLMGGDGKPHPFKKVRVKVGRPIRVPNEVTGYKGRSAVLDEVRESLQEMYSELRVRAGEPTADEIAADSSRRLGREKSAGNSEAEAV